MIKFDHQGLLTKEILNSFVIKINQFHDHLHTNNDLFINALGWVTYPITVDPELISDIKNFSHDIMQKIKYLLVIGIGGSYAGSQAGLDMINGLYPKDQQVKIIFIGHTLSSTYLKQVINIVEHEPFAICVISKSGVTFESNVVFRIFHDLLYTKVSNQIAKHRVIVITDQTNNPLKQIANKYNYKTFIIPDDIGGRFSVLTPVGLVVLAIGGVDIDAVLQGATKAYHDLNHPSPLTNPAYQYAILRNIMWNDGRHIELLATYELQMNSFISWWKQLFAESEGKDDKGLYPDGLLLPTDLHAVGQFIQEGNPMLFETIMQFQHTKVDLKIPTCLDNLDHLNYLAGESLHHLNNFVMLPSVRQAHSLITTCCLLEIDDCSATMFGYLVYFFQIVCALSAYLLDVNPFNQPGVDIYKTFLQASLQTWKKT